MPSNVISGISAAVGAGASIVVQPALDHAYCITEFANDAVFVTKAPDISVEIVDATHTDAIYIIDPSTPAVMKNGRPKEIYIDNATYVQITNTGGAGMNVGWTGYRVNANNVITAIYTITAGVALDVQPPAGETWKITEIAAERVGAANNPDVTIGLTEGTLVANIIMRQADTLKQQKLLNWIIDNTWYLHMIATGAGDNDIALIGIRIPNEAFCGIDENVGSAVTLITPAAEQEVVITEFGAETWAGVGSPNDEPDMTISLWDGAVLADIAEAGSIAGGTSLLSDRTLELHIDDSLSISILEISTGANEISWMGYVVRESNP